MSAYIPLRKGDVLLFEHIPKTAGSTLRRVLWQRFGSGHVIHTRMVDPESRTEELRARIRAGHPPRALTSHIGYGLHERLPGDLRYTHITILRDPIERTVSHYYFALDQGNLEEGTTLLDFCRGDADSLSTLRAWNNQTAYLSGLRVRQLHDGHPFDPAEYDEALLARAKANLDRFAAVGLVERFDESLLLLGRTFGWPLVALRSLPRNVGRSRRLALTDEERAALEAANQLDLALYRHAEHRFERLLAERVPDVPERLRALSRLNRAYRSVAPAVLGLEAFKRKVRDTLRAR